MSGVMYFGAEFKAKAGLEAIHGVKILNQIAQEHDEQLVQCTQWPAVDVLVKWINLARMRQRHPNARSTGRPA